ncbi:hypothetical protein EI94DRAFT_1700246, partial [Lactarius quietus]
RAIASSLSKPIRLRRTHTCLRALYHIPGAIRDLLASYAAGRHYCLEILPLLNSPESLEIIDELWNTPNDDVALSVRCAAAVVAAFMITPPRLHEYAMVGVRKCGLDPPERRALFETRHTEEYRIGRGTFDQQGDRASPAFVPAAQQDLITLALEILTRDPVANAATSQREAFRNLCMRLGQVATTQARTHARTQTQAQLRAPQDSRPVFEIWALAQVQTTDNIDMVRRALEPVLLGLSLPQNDMSQASETFPPQMPVPQIVVPVPERMVSTNVTPGPEHEGYLHRRQHPQAQATTLLIPQYSMSSSAGLATAAEEIPMWGAHVPISE